ncbi:MAG: ATP-binding cassette domain-containing protein [Muribaculaceae bacterium]
MTVRTVTGVAQVGFGLLLVWLCRRFIDYAVWNDNVIVEALLIFAVLATSITLRQTTFYLRDVAFVKQQNHIRERLYQRLLSRRLYASAESLHSGDIGQRLQRDIEAVSEITADVMPRMAVTVVQLLGAFALLHSMDAVLAWSLLLITPIVIFSAKYLAHRLRQMTLEIRDCESRVQMLVQESMEHEITLRTLESAPLLNSRMLKLQQLLHRLVVRRTRFTMLSRTLISATFGIGYFGAFVYGGLQLRDGAITFGVMAAFLQLVSQIQNPIMSALSMVPQVMHATASVDRLREIENMEKEQTGEIEYSEKEQTGTSSNSPSLPAITALGVRFSDVSYSYPGADRAILSRFSHTFEPGTTTIITGETGCGKTTLLRLTLGLIEPQCGSVELFDASGNTISAAQMRHYITYIPQGNTLMSGSIRDNLLLAAPDASEQQLRDALHTAVADFVLDLPNGLDTQIGERAIRLSEGQMQRLAIARSLLRATSSQHNRSSVLLLDEITSSLDSTTAQTLLSRLSAALHSSTILIVTHRPITLPSAQHLAF